LKYKAKYLELKAQLEGGIINESVRPAIPDEEEKKIFRKKYFNDWSLHIAYNVDNITLVKDLQKKGNHIEKVKVRKCIKNCDTYDEKNKNYELEEINGIVIEPSNGVYSIIHIKYFN
jgi:hypothetical protein